MINSIHGETTITGYSESCNDISTGMASSTRATSLSNQMNETQRNEANPGSAQKRPPLPVFVECLENALFMDYFNKFLSLPVFGQLIYYDNVDQCFHAFPNVNSASWFMRQEFLLEWLYEYRFSRYLNTKLYLEYKLCESLCSVDYFRHQDRLVEDAFEFLQLRFLRGVSKMKQFRQFLQDQPASTTHVHNSKAIGRGDEATESVRMANGQVQYCTGYIIYNFWLDAKQLQRTIENSSPTWYTLFTGMRDKYSHFASSMRLPRHLLEHHSLKSWDTEAIIRAASVFLGHLQYYWVPRYLLQVKNDGFNNTEIALFSLAKKYLCVKYPPYYPYCESVNHEVEGNEHDLALETIIKQSRIMRQSRLGFQASAISNFNIGGYEPARNHGFAENESLCSVVSVISCAGKYRPPSRDASLESIESQLTQGSLSKLSTRWLRKSRMGQRKRKKKSELVTSDIISFDLLNEKQQQDERKEKERIEKQRKSRQIQLMIQTEDDFEENEGGSPGVVRRNQSAIGSDGSDATHLTAHSNLSLNFKDMRKRKQSIVVVDSETEEESFSDDTMYSIDSDWTFTSTDGQDSEGDDKDKKRKSRTSMLRSSTSIHDRWRKSRTLLQMRSKSNLNRRSDASLLGASSTEQSREISPAASIAVPDYTGTIQIFQDDHLENLSSNLSHHIKPVHVERRYKFGSLKDPLTNIEKYGGSSADTSRKNSDATGTTQTAPTRSLSLTIPRSLTLTDKNANRIRDRRRSSIKQTVAYIDTIKEEESQLKLGQQNMMRNTLPLPGPKITEDPTRSSTSSVKGGLGGQRTPRMSAVRDSLLKAEVQTVTTDSRNPSKQNSLLCTVSPHFATYGVETFLRSLVNPTLHRDTSLIQRSMDGKVSKVEVQHSAPDRNPSDMGASIQVTANRRLSRSGLFSKHRFSKASLSSFKLSTCSSESDDFAKDVVRTFNEVGKSERKQIRQIRKTATFAFNLSANNDEAGEDEPENQPKQGRRSSSKSEKQPLKFEMNRDAINRAAKLKNEERRKSWSSKKQKVDPEEKRRTEFRNTKVSARRSTTVAGQLCNLLAFQQQQIMGEISYTSDRDWRAENSLILHAFQTDEHAGYPFRQWLYEEERYTQITLLATWVDLERLRSSEQLGAELRSHSQYVSYCKNIISRCLHDETSEVDTYMSPVLRKMLEAVECDTIFDIPIACIKLQRDIFSDLESYYMDFAKEETRKFRTFTCDRRSDGSKTNSRRVSFSLDGIDEMGDDDFEKSNYNHNIRARAARATALSLDLAQIHKFAKLSKEENNYLSDDNGEYKDLGEKKVFRTKKKLTTQEMYERVKVEYPATGYKYTRTELNTADDYLRPIRKQGNLIQRPTLRPKCIKDILKNQIHFEFFRRYLKYHKVEKMLVFWKAIEIMKNTVHIRQRQTRAQAIMEKFFHCPDKKPCELLFCNAPIIMEIPGLEIVTTSMLFSAQRTILHQMEVDWFQTYLETFPKVEEVQIKMTADSSSKPTGNQLITKGLRAAIAAQNPALFNRDHHKGKQHFNPLVADRKSILKTWVALCDWFRAAAKFIRCMENRTEYSLFLNFLTRIAKTGVPGTVTDSDGNQVSSDTNLNRDRKRPVPAKQVICGQLVTLLNLPNDLNFWIETDKFKSMFDQRQTFSIRDGKFGNMELNLVLKKAAVINDCFLVSRANALVHDGLPVSDSYINVPREICETITVSIGSGIIDNTIFSDAASYVFPILIHFWKIYREEYAKVAYNRWLTLAEDIKTKLTALKKKRRKRWNAPKTIIPPAPKTNLLDPSAVHSSDMLAKESVSQLKIPIFLSTIDQIKQLPVPKYSKKEEGEGDASPGGSRITFSVNDGVILHVPQDSFSLKAIYDDPDMQRRIQIIKSAEPDELEIKRKKKNAAKKEAEKRGKQFRVVIEEPDEEEDRFDSKESFSEKDKKKKKKNQKGKKNKKGEEDHDDSTKPTAQLSVMSRFKREMKRKDTEAQEAFKIAEKRLRASIREQVQAKKKFCKINYH